MSDFLDSHRRAEALADNLELEQPVAFTGSVDELARMLLEADKHDAACQHPVDAQGQWRCVAACPFDEERKRLAYADRAETLEVNPRRLLPDGHLVERVLLVDDGWRCAAGCRDAQIAAAPTLADGTGRHSRKEMELAREHGGCPDECAACHRDARARLIEPAPPLIDFTDAPAPSVISGVSFTSVPQLCAAYEYALETLRRLYAITDLKQHAFQPEQDVMREARALLLAAGKDVV